MFGDYKNGIWSNLKKNWKFTAGSPKNHPTWSIQKNSSKKKTIKPPWLGLLQNGDIFSVGVNS